MSSGPKFEFVRGLGAPGRPAHRCSSRRQPEVVSARRRSRSKLSEYPLKSGSKINTDHFGAYAYCPVQASWIVNADFRTVSMTGLLTNCRKLQSLQGSCNKSAETLTTWWGSPSCNIRPIPNNYPPVKILLKQGGLVISEFSAACFIMTIVPKKIGASASDLPKQGGG